jgi:hypothetical protein
MTDYEKCAKCHELRPRSSLSLQPDYQDGKVRACRDWYGCYQRFRAWMLRNGYWTVMDGKTYPVGRNRTTYQAVPDGPVLWTWADEHHVLVGAA